MILSVDPGKTTGVCYFDEDKFRAVKAVQISFGDVPDFLNNLAPVSWMVVEAFRLYPKDAKSLSWNDLPAPQIIGMLQAWCYKNRVWLVKQNAPVRKVITPGVLKAVDAWEMTRKKPHARDAARHAVWFCASKYKDRFFKALQDRGAVLEL